MRQGQVGVAHQRQQPRGDPDAGGEAGRGGEDADDERLGRHTDDDLAARRAEGAHQRGLTGALGDEDRERVVDAERRDDHGDPGERQQHRAEQAEEGAVDVGLLLGGELRRGQHLHVASRRVASHRLADAGRQLVVAHAAGGAHEHGRYAAGAAGEQALGRCEVEADVARGPEAVGVAERDDPDDGDGDAVRREDGRVVADVQVAALRAGPVDHHLGGGTGLGWAPLGELERAQRPVGHPAGSHCRRPVAAERLPIGTDDLGDALDVRHRQRHTFDAGDGLDGGRVDDAGHAILGRADAIGAAHHHVSTGVGRRERVPEAGLGGVAEDHRRGEERHAEHDGGARCEQPALAAPEAVHDQPAHADRPPNCFTRSSTRSADGWAIESTMRPSARNKTVSAWLAATASWVTITIV